MARFRTSARTVDMLGRQQIAGIPTAISELFKNAHDAYATRVEADFYRPEKLLVLRDNGLGMTLVDILERWLVLGTDSKLDGGAAMNRVASALDMHHRIPTGEKGIGRLAIAAIGPQVLLVTRARREDGLHSTVASFVNWSLFELPRISLDEIEVPVRKFPDGELPTARELSSLVTKVRENLEQLRDRVEPEMYETISGQLDLASFDVSSLQQRFKSVSLGGSKVGSQFFIQPTDPMLEVDLDAVPERRRIGELQKTLMGFTNTMMPDRPDPVISTEFRDHKSEEFYDSVIGPDEFFTPEEFLEADHRIRGEFDEFGQFSGTVSVYGEKPTQHGIVWPRAMGRKTFCGPFSISFAYVQGVANESRMARERWVDLIEKLDRMGGLYIYRNGIRILPYGNTDNDFLNIEERRNLGAGYYFFSYRRMFGAIELPPESSRRLIEKAGREGFRENRAYRQFRTILEDFLVQLAADFFRTDSTRGEYIQVKKDLDRQAKAREQRAAQSLSKRRALESNLAAVADQLSSGQAEIEVTETIDRLGHELESAIRLSDPDAQLREILRIERAAHSRLSGLVEELRVPQPRGFALTLALRRGLAAHKVEYTRFNDEVLKPAYAIIEEMIARATHNLAASRRRRFDAAAEDASTTARQAIAERSRASHDQLRATNQKINEAVRLALADLESELNDIAQRVQRTDLADLADADIVRLRLAFDSEIEAISQQKQQQLDAIAEQLRGIAVEPDETGQLLTQIDIADAVEEELLVLQERAEADLELTHLGMAIGIIDHEFQAMTRSLRNSLRRFRAWAEVDEELFDVYRDIRVNFDHLDSYLRLFTPLQRRLYRTEVEIRAGDIKTFLLDLFGERLKRHSVEVKTSRPFGRHRFMGYPSTFYPVFVNLMDNAIFWLKDRPLPRTIWLRLDGDTMIVEDNGPGVNSADRDVIFELGFTRKPGGRGLGLYVSRDVLSRVGYELRVAEGRDRQGSSFLIQPKVARDDD